MAAFNAFGMMLDVASGQIGASQIDGIQKILDGGAILDLKLGADMLDRKLQAPHNIPVFFQQFPGIMVQGIISNIRFNKFSHFRFLLFSCSSKGVSVSSKVAIEVFVPQRMVRPKWAVDFPRARGINSSQQSSDKGYNL